MSATLDAKMKRRFSVEEYLEREQAAEYKSEYVNGEIIRLHGCESEGQAMTGASETHTYIAGNLYLSLRLALRQTDFRVYPTDLKIKTGKGTYRYPDITILNEKPKFDGNRNDVVVNPLVIIEVLSPSTEAQDRGEKFDEYRTIESLQAYVLVSQDKRKIECLTPQSDGSWKHTFSDSKLISIPPLGCELKLDDVYDKVNFDTAST